MDLVNSMEPIISKIQKKDKRQTFVEILDKYWENEYCTINFIYFGNIVSQKLFEGENNNKYIDLYPERKNILLGNLINSKIEDYKNAILKSDFLMPDGIAIQILYFVYSRKILYNLNGTDFVPYFLDEIKQKYGNQKICLILYGTYPKHIEKTKRYFVYKGFNVIYHQNGYNEFRWNKLEKELSAYHDTINIMLVARTTPEIPVQELRMDQNVEKMKKNKIIVFTVGGLFDHMTGVQIRAPKIIRKIKLERLRRLVLYPKRNIKKMKNTILGFKYIFKVAYIKLGINHYAQKLNLITKKVNNMLKKF